MRELTRGLVFASLALFTVLAGLMLALSENRNPPTPARTPGQAAPTETLFVPSPVIETGTPIDAFALLQTQAPAVSATPCPQPPGWDAETVSHGDTLVGMAARSGVSLAALLQANCLSGDSTFVGAEIYLPLTTPTVAPTPACGPPLGWVFYTVQAGDTMFALSRRYRVAIYDLRQANCLPGVAITVGQNLYVPPVITNPNTPTATNTLAPSETLTSTLQPSATLTASATTAAAVAVATAIPPSATNTASPTLNPTATASVTETATLAATNTETATATSAPSDTATAAPTETPTTPAP